VRTSLFVSSVASLTLASAASADFVGWTSSVRTVNGGFLVNIFAGINRCDWVAQGVVQAYKEVGLTIPVVVRLAGTNVEEGKAIIDGSGLPLISADSLAEAAAAAVSARPRKAA
jgi:succinyl-CoA synthetase beta subunit